MLLRGLLGDALLLEGSGRGESFWPLLGRSCGCHRERRICDAAESKDSVYLR